MIIKRQKQFGLKEKVVKGILNAANEVTRWSTKRDIRSGAKAVAKSVNKSHEARVLNRLNKEYAGNPKLLERKISKLKRTRKGRMSGYEKRAEQLLTVQPNKIRSQEQIDQAARNISEKMTPESAVSSVVSVPKSVASGIGNFYKDTGKITRNAITGAGELVRKHPVAGPGWLSGDVVNAVGSMSGHPEVLAVPVGTIAGGTLLAGEKVIFPRAVRRKWRQKAIGYKKKRTSKERDWSLQKIVNEAKPYFKAPGLVGA